MSDPLLDSITEHQARAAMFLSEGLGTPNPVVRYRKLIAAVYFCQAIQEIMQEAVVDGLTSLSKRDEAKERLKIILPYADLVYRIRIHDFHRAAVVKRSAYRIQGPIKLKTGEKIGDSISVSIAGGTFCTSSVVGNSTLKTDRPLQTMGGKVFDEESKTFLPVETIVEAFVSKIPDAIAWFFTVYPKFQ